MLTSNLKKEKPMEVGHIPPNLPPSPLLVFHKGSSLLRSDVPDSQWQYLPLKQGSSLLGGRAPHVKWKSPREREHLVELVIARGNRTKQEAVEGGNWLCQAPQQKATSWAFSA